MNVKEYIASGILEVYVLGGLSVEESSEVERMMASHHEIKEEVLRIQDTLEKFAFASDQMPNPKIKGQLLNFIDGVSSDNNSVPAFYKYGAVAASLILIVSLSISVFLWNKWKNAEKTIVLIQEEQARYADNFNKASYKISQMENNLSITKDTSIVRVTMKGVALSPTSIAFVYWHKFTKEVYIDAHKLPTPAEGMQYQLWAIKDGKPIDAGIFEISTSNELQKVKTIQAADAYAITLEKRGGSASPTLSAMYVLGNV